MGEWGGWSEESRREGGGQEGERRQRTGREERAKTGNLDPEEGTRRVVRRVKEDGGVELRCDAAASASRRRVLTPILSASLPVSGHVRA